MDSFFDGRHTHKEEHDDAGVSSGYRARFFIARSEVSVLNGFRADHVRRQNVDC